MKILQTSAVNKKFEANVLKMFSEFNSLQKQWFRTEFPIALEEWINGDYDGKQKSKNPKLILSAKIPLDPMLLGLWCIRKCWGPIRAPALYRLTAVAELPSTATVTFSNQSQYKPLTGWSPYKLGEIDKRKDSGLGNSVDIRLKYANPKSKHILASSDMQYSLCRAVSKNSEHFFEVNGQLNRMAASRWRLLEMTLGDCAHENEHLIYLNRGDSFKCTWEPI